MKKISLLESNQNKYLEKKDDEMKESWGFVLSSENLRQMYTLDAPPHFTDLLSSKSPFNSEFYIILTFFFFLIFLHVCSSIFNIKFGIIICSDFFSHICMCAFPEYAYGISEPLFNAGFLFARFQIFSIIRKLVKPLCKRKMS